MSINLKKQGSVFIGIVYTLLFSFAIIFYFERLNSDAGYYFFHAVNSHWFYVEHNRLVLILAEILPVLGSLMHLPLIVLAILYSLNHVMFSCIVTIICLKKFQNLNAAIFITLLQFAGLKFSVFTPQFELFYGLTLLVFLIAFLTFTDSKNTKWTVQNHFIYIIFLIFIFTSHPMAIFCYFACMALYFFDKRHQALIINSFLFLLLYIIWKNLTISSYEQSKFSNFRSAINSHFMDHYFNFNFILNGIKFTLKYYADIWLVFIIGMIYFIKKTLYKNLFINCFLLSGSLIIIWLMFEPYSMGRYIEQVYFPFVFIACIWLINCELNKRLISLLFILFVYRSYQIIETSFSYRERSKQIAEFTLAAQNQPGTKFYVTKKEMGEKLYEQGNWSYGFETMLYSAIHCTKKVTITKSEDLDYKNNWQNLRSSDYLFRPFDIASIQSLNPHYFNLTEGNYQLLILPKTKH